MANNPNGIVNARPGTQFYKRGKKMTDMTPPDAELSNRNREFANLGSVDNVPSAYDVALEDINMSDSYIFEAQKHFEYFERLRKEDPVHYCKDGEFGPFWSVTKFNDIVAVDTNHKVFSSDKAITVVDPDPDFDIRNFIAMDQPKHDVQRKSVTPAVAPMNLAKLESTIRERVGKILDGLPVGETFNWVENVSVELTAMTLATLFDVPQEDRHKLIRWSDVATAISEEEALADGTIISEDVRREELTECLHYFMEKWQNRTENQGSSDLISLMATNPNTSEMIEDPMEFLGNLILLIVGGNDTTRNSISGGVLALNQNPAEYDKLRANPDLIPNMVSEIIRWVTPLGHMRRTALEDIKLGGKQIKKGDKVIMWYISGNRDDEVIDRANEFLIDRARARHHVSFGFGIHRCMGNRVGEMQLRILWEEIMNRFDKVEVIGETKHLHSCFVMGVTDMQVMLHPKKS